MATPLHASVVLDSCLLPVDLGQVGADVLGFDPMPAQREIWRLLEAKDGALPLYGTTVIEVPRRTGKTEAIFMLAVGRCSTLSRYQVTYCAQSGTKSRERFYALLWLLRSSGATGWRARESRGEERIEWANGSMLRFLPPLPASFRGDAIDWLILDEGQEVDEEDSARLLGAVLPTFDTRADAQLTVAGTAGEERSGLLWESLAKGRSAEWGILEYAAPEGADVDDPAVWMATHPGPAGTTPERALAVLTERHTQLSPEQFAREYLGIWPSTTVNAAFSTEVWQRAGATMPPRPDRFGLAFDVTPSGSRAAITATWRDGEGHLWGQVLEDRAGSHWVAAAAADLAIRYRLPVAHDTAGTDTLTVADEIARLYPKVTLQPITTLEFATCCAALSSAILTGTFRHPRQPPLDEAVEVATKRPIRDGGWAWGRKGSNGSIAPLVSVTVGIRAFDTLPKASRPRLVVAGGSRR